jgi:hypothetical protein
LGLAGFEPRFELWERARVDLVVTIVTKTLPASLPGPGDTLGVRATALTVGRDGSGPSGLL